MQVKHYLAIRVVPLRQETSERSAEDQSGHTELKHRPEEGVGVSSGCVMVLVVSIGLVN